MKRLMQILLVLCLLALIGLQIFRVISLKTNFVQVCPVDAISMINGKAVIDATKCIGCRRCVDGIVVPKTKASSFDSIATQVVAPPKNDVPISVPVPVTLEKQAVQKSKPVESQPTEKAAYKVIPNKCIGCQLCVPRCPVNAITMVDDVAVINPDKCINCGICANGNNSDFNGCPVSAISPPPTASPAK